MTIKERNTISKLLDEQDINSLIECLKIEKSSNINPQNQFINCAISDMHEFRQQLDIIDELNDGLVSKQNYNGVRKYYLPMSLGNIHWNMIEIVQRKDTVTCRQMNTDGYAYPLTADLMQAIQEKFIAKGYPSQQIHNLKNRTQVYAFSGQKEVNCGIICAYMAFDGLCDRFDQNRLVENYGEKITRHMRAQAIRDTTSETVNKHGTDRIKQNFCREREQLPPALRREGGSIFRYDKDNEIQRELYDALNALQDQELTELYTMFRDNELRNNLEEIKTTKQEYSFIFKNIEGETKDNFVDMINHVYKEKILKKSSENEEIRASENSMGNVMQDMSESSQYEEDYKSEPIKPINMGHILQGVILSMAAFVFFNTTIAIVFTTIILMTLSICIIQKNNPQEEKAQTGVQIKNRSEQNDAELEKSKSENISTYKDQITAQQEDQITAQQEDQITAQPEQPEKNFVDHIKSEIFDKKSRNMSICIAITGLVVAAYNRDEIINSVCGFQL